MPIYIVMRLEPWWNMALWTFEQNVGVGDWMEALTIYTLLCPVPPRSADLCSATGFTVP